MGIRQQVDVCLGDAFSLGGIKRRFFALKRNFLTEHNFLAF